MLNPSIFRAYDIRGIYSDELNEKTAYQIGRAFAVYLKENVSLRDISRREKEPEKVVVGHDARISSPVLKRSFIEGITHESVNVWDIGLVTVDMVYFASGYFHLPAAMITASHNPKEWNGFKLMKSNVEFFAAKDLCPYGTSPVGREIIISANTSKGAALFKKGEVAREDIKSDYLKHVLSFVDMDAIRPMRIAVNTSSGAVGSILKLIFEKLPLEINAGHYSFGCAFDSDGDRIVFVDEKGETINPSIIGALMAKYFLK